MDSIYGARGEVVSNCEVDGRHVFMRRGDWCIRCGTEPKPTFRGPFVPKAERPGRVSKPIPPQVKSRRLIAFEAADGSCYFCQDPISQEDFTIDHLQPLSRGGTNAQDNLVATCLRCNNAKGSMTEKEFRRSGRISSLKRSLTSSPKVMLGSGS